MNIMRTKKGKIEECNQSWECIARANHSIGREKCFIRHRYFVYGVCWCIMHLPFYVHKINGVYRCEFHICCCCCWFFLFVFFFFETLVLFLLLFFFLLPIYGIYILELGSISAGSDEFNAQYWENTRINFVRTFASSHTHIYCALCFVHCACLHTPFQVLHILWW